MIHPIMEAMGSSPTSIPNGARPVTLADGRAELVVIEEPIFLDIGGTRLLSLRTPMGEEADRDWALGFLASEGIIDDVSEVAAMEYTAASNQGTPENGVVCDEIRIRLWRSQGVSERIGLLARTHEMRASCGLCGVQSAAELCKGLAPLAKHECLSEQMILRMVNGLREGQRLFNATGGSHGSAIFSRHGQLLALAEDIGRHNAMDRAIGHCLRNGVYLKDSVVAISGRAGYELVMKALRVGIGTFLSVGAASTFALELARTSGMTLAGFIREHDGCSRMNVYSDWQDSSVSQ